MDTDPKKSSDDKRKWLANPAFSLGINLASGMFVLAFGGDWLDKKFHTKYWTLIGIFLGLIYCGYEVWKIIKQTNND